MYRYYLLVLSLCSTACLAAPRMSHHGEYITKCHNPLFFDEIPAKEATVSAFQDFSLTASDNTDMPTIKMTINNKPFTPKLERLRSNRTRITGHLNAAITEPGTILLKVSAESNDGCIAMHPWRVYVK